MKIQFTPINPPTPVRPADMPEGVAYEYEHDQSIGIAINLAGVMHTVNREGKAWAGISSLDADFNRQCEVLKRRDGQPLPHSDPVPLDTLEPFPVWYRRETDYFCRDQNGNVASCCYYSGGEYRADFEVSVTAKAVKVYTTPHLMEVQP